MNLSTSAFLLSFANSIQWCYGAIISPNANTTDGLLDLCLLKAFPRILSPILVIKLFNRSIHRSKFIDILPVKQVEIDGSEKYIGHIDGEPVEFSTPLRITVDPSSLKVICGPRPAFKHFSPQHPEL
jgi:diacylglycerol kinase family enzyme